MNKLSARETYVCLYTTSDIPPGIMATSQAYSKHTNRYVCHRQIATNRYATQARKTDFSALLTAILEHRDTLTRRLTDELMLQ